MFSFEIRTDIPEFRIINNSQTVDVINSGYLPDFKTESHDSKIIFHGVFEDTDIVIYIYDDHLEHNIIFWDKTKILDSIDFELNLDSRASASLSGNSIDFTAYNGQEILSIQPFILVDGKDQIIPGSLIPSHSFNSGKHKIELNIPTIDSSIESPIILRSVWNMSSISSAPKLMATGPVAFSFVAGEIDPVSRGIYGATPGEISYSIHLFQGLFTNSGTHPTAEKYIVDYPLNLYKGLPITGTVPLDPHVAGGETDIVEAYNLGLGLDTLTLYIEFVSNKLVGIEGYAPALFFDVIPPSSTAFYSVNNEADYIGNINGSSVYRGLYTVHKQSAPLYVDGTYKIRLKSRTFETDDMIFKVARVLGFFMSDVSELGGDAPIAP